jgi:capsular polysaccharide biosynthesis protein
LPRSWLAYRVRVLNEAAVRRGRTRAPGDRELFADLDQLLAAATPAAAVAVLHDGDAGLADLITATHPELRTLPVLVTGPAATVHVTLAAHGRFLLILDDVRDARLRAELFRECFWHLAAEGQYVVRNFRNGRGTVGVKPVGRMIKRLAEPAEPLAAKIPPQPRFDSDRLAAAMGPVVVTGRHLRVTNTRAALPVIREEEAAEFLAIRGPDAGRVLRTLPAVEFDSRCTLHTSLAGPDLRMPERYEVPALGLREYHDVVCAQEQVALLGHVALPDSYRHIARPRLNSRPLPLVAPRFAVTRRPLKEPVPLAGEYYYLDNEHRGHFGHVMTELLSKLWAWPELKLERPGLKALVALNRRREMAEWEYTLLEAAGIAREEVTVVRRPALVQTLIAAAPMLSMPEYVHPDISQVWRRMGDSLVRRASPQDHPERIFCSRRPGKRNCNNTREVEELFSRNGFSIVFPEDYSLPDQVALFRTAQVVAGFAGSALFNLCWSVEPKRVIAHATESYTARNEYLIAAVLGHELHFITSVPDISHPAKGPRSRKAFRSDFTFDLDREGRTVEAILRSL